MIREDAVVSTPQKMEVASPVLVTEAAAAKLNEVMTAKDLAGAGLRVWVAGGGCSGLQYRLGFEPDGGEEQDHTFDVQGLSVIIDPVSIQYLQGVTIDYVDDLMGGGFKIENPNAAASCGCGSSFKPKGEEGAAPQAGAPPAGGCGCG